MKFHFNQAQLISATLLTSLLSAGLFSPALAQTKQSSSQYHPVQSHKITPKSSVFTPIRIPDKDKQVKPVTGKPVTVSPSNRAISVFPPFSKTKDSEIKLVIEMSCPYGESITHLSYQVQEQDSVALLSQASPFNAYRETITAPMSHAQKIDKAYQKLQQFNQGFSEGYPFNTKETVSTASVITIQGKCSEDVQMQKQQFPLPW